MPKPALPPVTLTPDPDRTTDYVTAWTAQSRRHEHVTYAVTYDRLFNDFACQCPAYTYRGMCAHIEAAITAQVEAWRGAKRGRAA